MTFGSARQKTCFFKVLAHKMRAIANPANGGPNPLGGISCRDAFPKHKVNNAKALTKKGRGIIRSSKISRLSGVEADGCQVSRPLRGLQ